MPVNPELTEDERGLLEALLLVGSLAKFFHTPIPFFLNLDDSEFQMWLEIMEEISRRDSEAMEKSMKKGGA